MNNTISLSKYSERKNYVTYVIDDTSDKVVLDKRTGECRYEYTLVSNSIESILIPARKAVRYIWKTNEGFPIQFSYQDSEDFEAEYEEALTITKPEQVRVGYQTELPHKERQAWLKTREYRNQK